MKYSAILFDLDGTLVQSIDLYLDAFREALQEYNLETTEEEFVRWYMQGWHLQDVLEYFRKEETDVPNLRTRRDALYERLLRTKLEWLEGGEELLQHTAANYPTGIVTGSWKSYVDALNTRTPVLPHIRTLVTADDMGKFMKPHPHGLLMGADRLKIVPQDCLYIGDQLFDVEAARAAGMECCLYVGKHTPHEARRDANHIVTDLTAIKRIIG